MPAGRLKTAAAALVLLAANVFVARELFTTAYIDQMGSIEAAYIALARYIGGHWGELSWFPLWYNGVPFQNTYPPLLHVLVAAAAQALRVSPALAYHAVTAALYCLGPVTLFLLAVRLSGSRLYSFAAALLYSVFSPVALLVPAARADLGGLWNARRFQALAQWGEGPHVAALTLLPLAVLLLDVAFAKRRPGYYLLAALSMAAVVLTNWLGAAALAGAVLAWALAQPLAGSRRAWLTALAIGAAAYAIAAPCIPPSTLAAIRVNAQRVGGPFTMGMAHLRYAGLLLVALALLAYLFERFKPAPVLRFALVFTLPMAALTLGWAWLGVYLLPQPERYQLEMEMGIALAAAFAARPLLQSMSRRQRALVAVGCLVFAWFQLKTYRGYARWLDRPLDIHSTVEYQAARWLDDHMDRRRVFAAGSVGFWLNAFADTPQLSGGFDQGITNPLLPAVVYQVYSGQGAGDREAEVAIAWLKAYGVHAVFVGGPRSREYYKPFRNGRKFEGRLAELWRDGDDAIYALPQRSVSLAHVLRPADAVARQPSGGLDVEPLQPYLAALDRPSEASFRWLAPGRARIAAGLAPGEILSVQITGHPGWHATVNGRERRLWRDGLGLLLIDPHCGGPCTVELHYDGGREMLLARLLSWLTLAGAAAWAAAQALGLRRRSLRLRRLPPPPR